MGRLTVYVPSAVLEVVATDCPASLLADDLPLFGTGPSNSRGAPIVAPYEPPKLSNPDPI